MAVILLDEYLEVEGFVFATPNVLGADLTDLRSAADVRGGSVLIPHGSPIPQPQRKTESERSLPLEIWGGEDENGDPVADYNVGINTTLAAIAAITTPVLVAPWTRTATLHLVTGDLTATVQLRPLRLGARKGARLKAVLTLLLTPVGEFT